MTTKVTYFSKLEQNKEYLQSQLDNLLKKHKAQPVGNGYGDIIVPRDSYINFINELTILNLAIETKSWWCHCTPENERLFGYPHGYGGPKSKYFDGWFSERVNDFDKIEVSKIEQLENTFTEETVKKINEEVLNIIENKRTITYANGDYQVFKKDKCLTPAIWIRVPEDWTNSEERGQ